MLLLLWALPATVQAQFTYSINNGTVTITRYTGSGAEVTVPSAINGLPVTKIGKSAFNICTNLTKITLPNSVTTIGDDAFYDCINLTNLSLPDSVTNVGNYAFLACSGLTTFTMSTNITSLGQWAFYACTSLGSVTIPNSITTINDYTFWACSHLTNVTIPNSVTYIGNAAFGACVSLPSLKIPDGVTSIQAQTFLSCASLTNVAIPSSVTTIGDDAFSGCTSLTSITIPDNVTKVGVDAFGYCTNLSAISVAALNSSYSSVDGVLFNKNRTTLVEFPGGKAGSYTLSTNVSSIGSYAFAGCLNLTDLTIPGSVKTIAICAFLDCSGLTSAMIPSGVSDIEDYTFDGCTGLAIVSIPESVTNVGSYAFYVCSNLTSVTIPNSVTSIGNCAFEFNTSLASVALGNSVTNLGVFALYGCTSLSAINVSVLNPAYSSLEGVLFDKSQTTLIQCPAGRNGTYAVPNSVASVGDEGFDGCISLTNVLIGNSVTSVGNNAFMNCNNLASVTLGTGVTGIGDGAFYYCTSLNAINVDPLNSAYSSVDGILFDKSQNTLVLYPAVRAGGYTIPEGVTSIADAAFQQCSGLTSVTIPNSVENIGRFAFRWCMGLTTLTIPGSVASIGDSAFEFCTNLSGIYFEGNAPYVGYSVVFDGISHATVYYLPGTTGWGPTYGGLPTMPWIPPALQTVPQPQTAESGSVVDFWAQATNALPLNYLWYFNNTNFISGGTNCWLELTNVQFSHSGAYTAVISNALGAVTSAPAMLSVIPVVERRPVSVLNLKGETGSMLNIDYTSVLNAEPYWNSLASVSLTSTPQFYFDLTAPLPPQRFYRVSQTGTPSVLPSLNLHIVPAITLTGNLGDTLRLDYINQFGPTDAWVALDTITLTNTSQLYFDVSSIGQPPRLWRIVPVP